MSEKIPEGNRFSHIYVQRGRPTDDSTRMRRRIAALAEQLDFGFNFAEMITLELGVDVPRSVYRPNWRKFYADCEVRDVLDSISTIFRCLRILPKFSDDDSTSSWVQEINSIFAEENVQYRVDGEGIVHFSVDEEFALNHASTISALQDARYGNVRHEFNQARAGLDSVPPNGKEAIRKTFSAAEGLFRLMFPKAPRLTADEIKTKLGPVLEKQLSGNKAALRSSARVLAAFADWVEAAHFYRHEQGSKDIAQPDLSFAVNLVSLGAAHIRWLAEIDARESKHIQ